MTENNVKSKVRAKITEIIYLAMLCEEIGYYCFINYQAHVNKFEVRLHDNHEKWDDKPITTEFYIKGSDYELNKCNNVIYQLKSILRKNKVDYNKLYEIERIEIDYVF